MKNLISIRSVTASETLKMFPEEYKGYYDYIIEVIYEAGQMVIEGFRGPKKIETKGASYNLVTDTDKNTEEFLICKIKHRYPQHLILAEESTPAGTKPTLTDAHTWIIDPIDGTINFTREIPLIAISVALAIKKEVVLGVVFNPIMNQFYSAVKGGGAYCNGKRITSSKTEDLHKAIIGNELSLSTISFLQKHTIERVKALAEFGVLGFRSYGSAAVSLCFVADGSLDVYYTPGLQCWDVAAGVLILQEAGGFVCNPNGKEFDMFGRNILTAGNQTLIKKMVEILSECDSRTKDTVMSLKPKNL